MTSAFLQGFSPVLPILVLIFTWLICISLAWWSYQYISSISTWKKVALIGLRGSTFTILILLLFNPFLQFENIEIEKPSIFFYFDNSQSVDLNRGEYEGINSYNQTIEEIRRSVDENYDYRYFLFDGDVSEGNEVDADGSSTNIQRVIEHISENDADAVAFVMVSDGIYTRGRNPIFSAQSLSTPIFTIPIGDTTEVQDVRISNVDFNQIVYTNTSETIRVNIEQDGYSGETARVELRQDENTIETETIEFTESSSSHIVDFTIEFDEPGFFDYEITIPGLTEEFTQQNNTESLTIEVLDDKTQILSLAFEIHPDVASIRRVMATDQQNEVTQSTQLREGVFTGSNPIESDEDYDLIVLHGLPPQQGILTEWLDENSSIPIVILQTPNSYQYSDETSYFPHSINSAGSILDIHLTMESDPFSHPLMEFDEPDFRGFPTLKSWRSNYELSPLSTTLLGAEYQRTETNIPILITESDTERRHVFVNAFGWHQFEKTSNETVNQFFTDLFTNIFSWAATSPDNRNLVLEPAQSSFTENDPVLIRGTLVNERGEPESDATIELQIVNDDDENSQSYRMRSVGNGDYEVELGAFPQGLFELSGTAEIGGRQIGEATTTFSVSQSTLEFVNTKRNDQLLTQLAARTGGLFLSDNFLEPMFDLLEQQEKNIPIEIVEEEVEYISDLSVWFFIALLFLSAEWILRRTVSLP
ncbi:MAG: hypothetical protein WEA58_00500 [Balneolaceae bacterium]